ncbi:MAG TPA: NADH-quinone oxidoreductase subunit A [Candidatus Krumholzibacteria bacterium]|nr:NADH-quinone oxidoreductase subunit A [Candidatus Krumholzibacteria bacterium]HPD71413.1 NADH-quinone oxidoreductase subunit A [Candidatus Krumholzibacteria bacterium]HRY41654.1 NADH-quinone oxidoreductase subunit A [Candidatus Krumholzibacteria bacterium]
MTASAVPVLLVLLVAVLFAALFLVLSYWLGPRRRDPLKESPYECGIPARGTVQIRFFVRFFLVALFFLIFDLEAVFLYPWVLVFRSSLESGAAAFALGEMGVFLAILVTGFVYVWRKGGLEWQ